MLVRSMEAMKIQRLIVLTISLFLLAALPAFSSNEATNTNTVSPTLVVNVTVQKAIRLTLATGTQCAVNAGGGRDYNINFGNVDALAINTASCGGKFAPAREPMAADNVTIVISNPALLPYLIP